ncbi:MAG: hypothetical protein LBG60_03105 [Bifidobacteriaceae bacterium]|jgi:serpin B|nr:hypothetical protein [Bifidobacteriaceae bacterium]
MARIKQVVVAALSVGAAAALVGCGQPVAGGTARGATAASPSGPVSGESGTPDPAEQPPPGANAVAWFGERLFPAVQAATAETPNPIYSPLSVYLALSMVGDGAAGATAEEFAAALAADRDQANQAAAALLADYAQFDGADGDRPTLKLADSVWVDDEITLTDAFKADMIDVYQSEPKTVDFGQPDSAEPVNQWVSDQTNGLIKQILDQQTAFDLMLYLANAVYFKASWFTPAQPFLTAPADFAAADGRTVQADMMTFEHAAGWLALDDGTEGALLNYGDGRFAMLAVMPAGGVEAVDWTGQTLAGWLEQIETPDQSGLTVKLPKWEADSEPLDLIPALRAAGLESAFDDRADLSGIDGGAHGLFISSVAHRAIIKVDEAGTEAAAATGIAVACAAISGETRTVLFDRPFAYSIIDTTTGLPIFLGQVGDPTVK